MQKRLGRRGRGRAAAALVAAAAMAPALWSLAQPQGEPPGPDDQPTRVNAPARGASPVDPPPLSRTLERLLKAEYLSPEERKERRLFHGVWEEGDIDSPAAAARIALLIGAYADPSLTDAAADPLDRAEGALRRGEVESALALLEGQEGIRAARIRAEALAALGRYAEAAAAVSPVLEALAAGTVQEAADQVEAMRALTTRIRVAGPVAIGAAGDFHAMMATLADVRDRIDRLYWPAMLAEAELLLEKDNPSEAHTAVMQTLSLNPSCARAWHLLGRMAVYSFNFAAAEQVADRLDALAARLGAEASPLAADLRARVALRQIDGDGAAATLAPALRIMPHERGLLALQAAAAAVRFDLNEAEMLAAEYDALSPGGAPAEALFEIGRALAEARQYGPAADFLRRAHERLPTWAEPAIELGLMEMQSGRDEEALAALRTARQLDPFNVRADNSLKLATELASYATIESEHFVVRYRPGEGGPGTGADAALAQEMLPILERIHADVTGDGDGGIDHEPAQKTVIELMPDHRWFAVRIAGMPRLHTIAASTGPVIAMEAPREGANHLGTYDWARVVRHEYVHTVTLSRTNNRIPHWFTEAAAVYLEQAPREYQTARMLASALEMGSLFDFNKINIAFVRPERPSDRSQAYAQGHWMYEYMIERFGREAPLRLMDLYAQGVREESAFQQVLGRSRAEFFDEFRTWARDQVRSWGLSLPEGVPTVRALLMEEAQKRDSDGGPAEEPDAALEEAVEAPARNRNADGLPTPTIEMVEGWLATYPDHPEALELAIHLRLREAGGSPTPELVPLLERYAAVRPVDPMPHRLLAQLYLGRKVEGRGPEAAIEHLEYLDAREQKSPAYAAELARRYAALGRWDEAAAKAERATQVAPYNAEMRELAATVAIKRSDFDTAERHLWALTQIEPDRKVHTDRLEALKRLRAGAK